MYTFSLNVTFLLCFAIQPHGDNSGCLAFVRPPFGWSTGFFATPRTTSFFFQVLLKPHLPSIKVFSNKFGCPCKVHQVCWGKKISFLDGKTTQTDLDFFSIFFLYRVAPELRAYVHFAFFLLNSKNASVLIGKTPIGKTFCRFAGSNWLCDLTCAPGHKALVCKNTPRSPKLLMAIAISRYGNRNCKMLVISRGAIFGMRIRFFKCNWRWKTRKPEFFFTRERGSPTFFLNFRKLRKICVLVKLITGWRAHRRLGVRGL